MQNILIIREQTTPFHMKNYIQELLYEYNSVIIPAFGGFTTGYKPASIDHVQGMIFPPSKDLKFNRYLTINDGVLVRHLCEAKGWTREEAETAIKDWVGEMKSALERREMLEFPNVGRLYLDYEGNFRFLQDNTNYNRDSFGLPPVGFYPVTRNRQAPVQEAPQPRQASAVIDLAENSSRSRIISGWFQRNIPYIVAATFLIFAGTVFLNNSDETGRKAGLAAFTKPVSEERINTKPRRVEDTDIQSLYLETEEVSDVLNPGSEEEVILDETDKEVSVIEAEKNIETEGVTTAPSQKEAIIIIGSFGNKSNADRLVKKVYRLGYEPFTTKENGLTKIGVRFAYDKLSEIESKRREVADDFAVKAWIMQPKTD